MFNEFAEFTEIYKVKIVYDIACIICCGESSFSISELERTLFSERKKLNCSAKLWKLLKIFLFTEFSEFTERSK